MVPAPGLYRRRWFMLAMFALQGLSNSVIQFTFASISRLAVAYYGNIDAWKVNMMAITYQIHILVAAPVAAVVMARLGLRVSVVTCAVLQTIGCIVRLAAIVPREPFFWLAFVGQTLCAIAAPFQVNGSTTLAGNWFGGNERTLATTIGSFSAILGAGVAFGLCPLIAGSGTTVSMSTLFGSQLAITIVLLFFIVIFLRDRPPTAPTMGQHSNTASSEEANGHKNAEDEERIALLTSPQADASGGNDTGASSMSFVLQDTIRPLFNKDFLILTLAFMCGFSTVNAFLNLVNQVTAFHGYSTMDASIFGMTIIFMGLVGATANGIMADLTKRYHVILLICGGTALLSYAVVTILLMYEKTWLMFALLCVAMTMVGAFGVSIVPVTYELAVELTWPAPPSYSSTVVNTLSNVFTVVVIAVMTTLELPHKPGEFGDMKHAMLFSLGVFAVAIVLMLFVRGRYKRLEHEKLLKRTGEETTEE